MSVDGPIVAAIVPKNNNKNGNNSGYLRVFDFNVQDQDPDWIQCGSDLDGEEINDESESLVAMLKDVSTIVIGAWENDGNGDYS